MVLLQSNLVNERHRHGNSCFMYIRHFEAWVDSGKFRFILNFIVVYGNRVIVSVCLNTTVKFDTQVIY